MKDTIEKLPGVPAPAPIEPIDPIAPPPAAMQLCLHCKEVLTETEAKAHKKGTNHDLVPYP